MERLKMQQRNQVTKPVINKIGQTQKEPRRIKLYFKNHGCTILIARNVPHMVALQIEHAVTRICREHEVHLEGVFIQTQ